MLDWVLVILLYYIILCTLSNSLIFLDFFKTVLTGAVAFVKFIQVRILFRSRCSQVLYERAALKNFTKFIKILQLWSPYLVKLQRISANLFKSRVFEFCEISKSSHQDCSSHWCFPVNIAKFLRAPISKNICKQHFVEF